MLSDQVMSSIMQHPGVESLLGKGKLVFSNTAYVPGSKLPLFPYNRGWSSTEVRRGFIDP